MTGRVNSESDRTPPGTKGPNPRQTKDLAGEVGSKWARSRADGRGPTVDLPQAGRKESGQTVQRDDSERSKPERPQTSTAVPGRLGLCTESDMSKEARLEAARAAPGRAAPEANMAEPAWQLRREGERLKCARLQADAARPKRARLCAAEAGPRCAAPMAEKLTPGRTRPTANDVKPERLKLRAAGGGSDSARPHAGAEKSSCERLREGGGRPKDATERADKEKPSCPDPQTLRRGPGHKRLLKTDSEPGVLKSHAEQAEPEHAALRDVISDSIIAMPRANKEAPRQVSPEAKSNKPACDGACKGRGGPGKEKLETRADEPNRAKLRAASEAPACAHPGAEDNKSKQLTPRTGKAAPGLDMDRISKPGSGWEGSRTKIAKSRREALRAVDASSKQAKPKAARKNPILPTPGMDGNASGRTRLREGGESPR